MNETQFRFIFGIQGEEWIPPKSDETTMSHSATDLQTIPGVGPSIAVALSDLGFSSVEQLTGHDPDGMFDDLCKLRNESIDPCVKYVFRCAIYFASHEVHDPALLQWWNWKDRTAGWDRRP